MESCLLCLEIHKDLLDSIKANSTQWHELRITKLIEKHFWPLSTVQPSSWICLTCWQELNSFHKFYMRIEEAHINFGRLIKTEDEIHSLESKRDLIDCKPKINDNKEDAPICCLEPEVFIDQASSLELVLKKASKKESAEVSNFDDESLQITDELGYLDNDLKSKDPLEKLIKCKENKPRKGKNASKFLAKITPIEQNEEELEVKLELGDLNRNEDSDSDNDANYQSDRDPSKTIENKCRKSYYKHRTNRKEKDKFIAEHFKQMSCDICQAPFENFPMMHKHFSEVHKQRGYVICCKRKFFDRTRLVDHINCHLNPDQFKCSECGKVMSDRISFHSHMLRVHRKSEVVKKHFCDACGKSFSKAYVLRIHKLGHLPEEEKKFSCTDCGKNYGSPYLLNQHRQAVHLKRFVKICYICGKSISSSAEYKVHMNKHEGIPAPIIGCDICGLCLTSERGLKLHKESQHPVGGKQEHCCPMCHKISPTPKALKKHINTMHIKGYDHKCSICEKAFKRTEALKEHMATHTGTTLYTCPWCPKTFNSNGNMHAHRKKIHPKEWVESKLQRHLRNLPQEI